MKKDDLIPPTTGRPPVASGATTLASLFLPCLALAQLGTAIAGEADMRVGPRRAFSETVLVRAKRSECVVVYPSRPSRYRRLATEIQSAIYGFTGVRPRALTDVEATHAEHPVLREELARANLILLGRLGINRAIWPVYNRFLCAVDGYYPGGNGYVARTASNVFGNGRNTIVVGGSSDEGAARGVRAFAAIVRARKGADAKARVLRLPWLLEVVLEGECKAVFERDEAAQRARGFYRDGSHDYSPARRVYENFMSYYWSGRPYYLDLGGQYLNHVLTKGMGPYGIAVSHYGMEFFVRAYDMLDDSGRLSPEQVRRVDEALLTTFDGWPKPEGRYLELARTDAPNMVVRDHQAAALMSEETLCRFVLERLNAPDEVKREAARRREIPKRAMDQFIRSRWRGCAQGSPYTDVPTQAFFRYALETEQYAAFFDSGNARKAALYHLARCANPDGSDIGLAWGHTRGLVDFKLFLGICASYYRDGGYKYVVETMPARIRPHYGVNVNGVHRYRPGDEIAAKVPRELLGATWLPLEPVLYRRRVRAGAGGGLPPYDRAFDPATIRGGFRPKDDYLLMTGAGVGGPMPANVIVRLAGKGQYWLTHTASTSYFDQNALNIERLGKWATGAVTAPELSRLNHVGGTDSAAFLSATLAGSAGSDWRRDVVWLRDRFWIVFDTVTARSEDDYAVTANWRVGDGRLAGRRWIARRGDWEFVVAPCTDVEPVADTDTGVHFSGSSRVFRQRIRRKLAKGESLRFTNLLFVRPAGSDLDYATRVLADGSVLARLSRDREITLVGALPKRLGSTDAARVVVRRDGVIAFDATFLELGGRTAIRGRKRATLRADAEAPAVGAELEAAWRRAPALRAVEAEEARTAHGPGLRPPPLKTLWRFTGARKPGRITGVAQVARNIFDLGRDARLAEVRTVGGELPRILIAENAGEDATFRRLVGAVSEGCDILMRNYGRTLKREKLYQVLKCAPQRARRVRVVSKAEWTPDQLVFYDADRPEARERMEARVVDLDGDGKSEVLLRPRVWPGRRDTGLLEHEIYVLNSDGSERWRRAIPWRMHFARPLAWDGSGRKDLFVGSLDSNVYVLDPQGKLVRTLTLAGSRDLRHYPCPSAIGAWQPDAKGRRKLVLPRYHWTGFLDRDGKVEGHVNTLGYWTNDVLGQGADITGDGVQDTVLMHSTDVVLVNGVKRAERRKPTRGPAMPMPYRFSTLKLPAVYPRPCGSPTLAFRLLDRSSPRPRYLLVARWNMVGVADLRAMKWVFRWVPLAPLTAFCDGRSSDGRRQFVCAGRDGLLRVFDLSDKFAAVAMDPLRTPGTVNNAVPFGTGAYLLACDTGLYRFVPPTRPVLLKGGSFVDVAAFPGEREQPPRFAAVATDGAVECLSMAPTGRPTENE